MTKQESDIILHGKDRLKRGLRNVYGYDTSEFPADIQKMSDKIHIIFGEMDIYDELTMNQAMHKESAINYFKEVFKLVEEVSGIDLKKEKDLNEKRYKEFIDLIREGIEVYKKFTNELEKLNKNFSENQIDSILKKFEILNKIIEYFEKVNMEKFNIPLEPKKKKVVEKKDPFEIMVPENFWEDLLKDEDFFDEEE